MKNKTEVLYWRMDQGIAVQSTEQVLKLSEDIKLMAEGINCDLFVYRVYKDWKQVIKGLSREYKITRLES